MAKKEIFYFEESPYQPGYFLIRAKQDDFYMLSTTGSFNLMPARLLGLSYAQYLRFCRDILGATLIGKGDKYPIAYFKKGENLFGFMRMLNGLANLVLFDKENPDHLEHKKIVDEYKQNLKGGK